MVPYDPPPPPRGGARRFWDAKSSSDFWPLKKRSFFISKNPKNCQISSNIKEFWPFDVWKRIPMRFLSFWSKNHWKLTILSRVMILFGFKLKIWYHKVPYGTIRYHVKTKKYHNSTQNCPFPMIFGPKWPKFHGDSFPDVKRSKFLYIWWVLTIFVIFW